MSYEKKGAGKGAPVAAGEVSWSGAHGALADIRRRVFVVEQRVPEDLEWDGLDDAAATRHFLAVDDQAGPVGCARLLGTGQIGRMAVLPEWRGKGVGALLLGAAVDAARAQGLPRVFLHAQTHAVGFYGRFGFAPRGAEFMDAGMPHMEMVLEDV